MKILYITTIGGTMGFFKGFIRELIDAGNTVEIATNENGGDTPVPDYYKEWGCRIYPVSCSRSPLRVENSRAVKKIRKIVSEHKYDIVHCHTPVAAACTRLACRALRKKMGTRVFYTAHGFHFYTGAPLKNWLFYYPAEWVCSWWTDTLITINKEDYSRAKKHLHAKRTVYVPGVGIDLKKFSSNILEESEKELARRELGVSENEKMLLSVGELIPRKNHESVIRAIAKLDHPSIKYFICGTGQLQEYLQKLIDELGMAEKVKLLGYRTDIPELCRSADLFVFPSIQEGLPVALMEAIASKTPVICSKIRGNTDLMKSGALFAAKDIDGISGKITDYLSADKSEEIESSYRNLKKYAVDNVVNEMRCLYFGGNKA